MLTISSGENDKRVQIIKAAVKVFSRKGFHEAKVEEIAQLADVGKGTVYEYFSSKTELFEQMFKTGIQFYSESIKREIKPGMTASEKLTKIAQIHFNFFIKYKDLARITMNEHTYFNEDFRQWIYENRRQKVEILKQIISEGIEKGEFRRLDSRAAAEVFMGALAASCSAVIFNKEKLSCKRQFEPVMDIIFNGLLNIHVAETPG